jgi:hypothetical protein
MNNYNDIMQIRSGCIINKLRSQQGTFIIAALIALLIPHLAVGLFLVAGIDSPIERTAEY